MATVRNRSPWVVSIPKAKPKKFPSKAKALNHLDTLDNTDKTKATVEQLNTAFECQVRKRDSSGNTIYHVTTWDTYEEALAHGENEDKRLEVQKKKEGEYNLNTENMTLKIALEKVCEEHYKEKACYKNHLLKIPKITQFFGEKTLLKDIPRKRFNEYKKKMKKAGYSASTIRDYFSLLSRTYKQAMNDWDMDISSPVKEVELDRPDNAIQRYWKGDEKERLFISINKHRPIILNPVLMSLELTFRRGELVPLSNKEEHMNDGLQWEGVDFANNTLTLFTEKSDHTKKSYERKGRTVPMTVTMRTILEGEWEKSKTKSGQIFGVNGSSLTKWFGECCDKAEPPIENLTFHSLRKISTTDWGKKVKNPLILQKISSHKDIQTLSKRYFDLDLDTMRNIVEANDDQGDPVIRAINLLTNELGKEKASEILLALSKSKISDNSNPIESIKKSRAKPSK